MLTSLDHRCLDVGSRASAARVGRGGLSGLLVSAGGLLAHQLALGARAESRLLALPVALGLLAHGRADGIGSSTSSTALSRGADSLTLGAVVRLAQILRAADIALGLVAMNLARSARGLLAVHLALRSLADRVALGRARGIIALPSALGVALGRGLLELQLTLDLAGQSNLGEQQYGEDTDDQNRTHGSRCVL